MSDELFEGSANYPFATWREEKTLRIITRACMLLADKEATAADMRLGLTSIIEKASKLLCKEYEELHGDGNRWSPDLVQYLVDHPERVVDTLQVVSSEGYRDGYFDDEGGHE